MTTEVDLLTLTAAALSTGTDARGRVYTPGDWPSASTEEDEAYPLLKLRTPRAEKRCLGRGSVEFTVVVTIRIIGQVTAPATFSQGALAAEQAAYSLARQCEQRVINNPAIKALLQQYPSVSTHYGVTAEGEVHVGGFVMDVGMEFYQGPEDFFPVDAAPLTMIDLTTQYPTPSGPNLGFSLPIPQS